MILNFSQTRSAVASRKWSLTHPKEAAAAKLAYLRNPKNKSVMWKCQKKWLEEHKEYRKEYMRITAMIAAARRHGDATLEHELRIERKMHRMTLPNRKTLGRIVVEQIS